MTFTKRIAALAAFLLVLAILSLELSHFLRYGHFFPFRLHADVVVRKADLGIRGIRRVYEPKRTNHGIGPVSIRECDFLSDVMVRGTDIAYTLEKWDSSSGKWEDTLRGDRSGFCHPYPLGMTDTHLANRLLWPGQSISAGEEATAARHIFAIGDKARFVAFSQNGVAFPTVAFSIDECPTFPSVPHRVRH